MTDIPEGVIGSYKVTLLVDRKPWMLDPADWDWEALCGPDTKVVDCHLVGVRLDDDELYARLDETRQTCGQPDNCGDCDHTSGNGNL